MSGQTSTTSTVSVLFPFEPEKQYEDLVRGTSLIELRTQESELPKGVRNLFWKIEQSNDQKSKMVFLSRSTLRGLCHGDGLLTAIAIALASREHGFEII